MHWISIHHAHEYWSRHRKLSDPATDFEDAEAFILGQRPHTAQDAACMLDVVCAYKGDVRCDGLDHAALALVRDFLLNAPEDLSGTIIT